MPTDGRDSGCALAEFQLGRRGTLTAEDEQAVAANLAKLAVYPWTTGRAIDWGQAVGLAGEFPTFMACNAVFLSGPLAATADPYIRTPDGTVRIITVVPTTQSERALAKQMRPTSFIRSLMKEVDISEGRT